MVEKKSKPLIKSHILRPKHSKLSEKDKKALFERYGITVRQLPGILSKDPALANLDAKEGDVIKIERPSVTAGKTVFYRGVMNE